MRRVLFFGQKGGTPCLDVLTKDNKYEVIGVVPGTNPHQTGFEDIIKKANSLHIPLFNEQQISSLDYDILLSVQYDKILKKPVISKAKIGAYNLHFSKLPEHRGCHPLNWAILEGSNEMGVTLHKMAVGIDNGPIISQKVRPLNHTETALSLYHLASEMAASLLQESLHIINNYSNGKTQPIEPLCYHTKNSIDYSKVEIPFDKDLITIDRFIRSRMFDPLQRPTIQSREIKGLEKIIIGESSSEPITVSFYEKYAIIHGGKNKLFLRF